MKWASGFWFPFKTQNDLPSKVLTHILHIGVLPKKGTQTAWLSLSFLFNTRHATRMVPSNKISQNIVLQILVELQGLWLGGVSFCSGLRNARKPAPENLTERVGWVALLTSPGESPHAERESPRQLAAKAVVEEPGKASRDCMFVKSRLSSAQNRKNAKHLTLRKLRERSSCPITDSNILFASLLSLTTDKNGKCCSA